LLLCSLQLVELKNGETYNGHLVNCDTWMNIHLREVICTSKVSAFASCVFFFSSEIVENGRLWAHIVLRWHGDVGMVGW
jgi:small nuclear ribonucleoprotein (snRNP)-like protein